MRASWRFFHIFCLHNFLQWNFSHFLRGKKWKAFSHSVNIKYLHCEFLHVQQCMKNEWELSYILYIHSTLLQCEFHMSPKIQRKAEKFSTFLILLGLCPVCLSKWMINEGCHRSSEFTRIYLYEVWVLLYTFKFGIRLKTFLCDYSHYISLQSQNISST